VSNKERVDSGRVERAHCVACCTDQRISEQVKAGVVQDRHTRCFAIGEQQLVVKRILTSVDRVHPNEIFAHDGSREGALIFRANTSDGG
jgi:hypothetical protein